MGRMVRNGSTSSSAPGSSHPTLSSILYLYLYLCCFHLISSSWIFSTQSHLRTLKYEEVGTLPNIESLHAKFCQVQNYVSNIFSSQFHANFIEELNSILYRRTEVYFNTDASQGCGCSYALYFVAV